MTHNFTRLSEIPESESFILLGYGPSGSGKTFFGGSAGSDTLFVSNGNGLATLQSLRFKKKYPDCSPLVFVPAVPSLSNPTESINSIRNGINEGLDKFGDKIKNIIIDDSTSLRNSVMHEALQFNQDTKRSQTLTDLIQRKYNFPIPAVQDYGTEMEFIEGFMDELINRICRPEKKNLIVLAHQRQTFKKAKNIGDQPELIRITPSFTGVDKNPDLVVGLFDNVWYFETAGEGDRVFYRIRTEGSDALTAKTRSGGLFKVLEKDGLDFPEVMRRVKGKHLIEQE